MNKSLLRRKGMIAILFIAVGFFIFAYLVASEKVITKTTFVGKDALETYLGGQHFPLLLFTYRTVASTALHDAVAAHAERGGLGQEEKCVVEGRRLWLSGDCVFSSLHARDSFFQTFDQLFHERSTQIADALQFPVTLPFSYSYFFEKGIFTMVSKEAVTYISHNHTYKYPITLLLPAADVDDYLGMYSKIFTELDAQRACLISKREGAGDYHSCFAGQPFSWKVSQRGTSLFFGVHLGDFRSWKELEISFAIDLNSLENMRFSDAELVTL